HRGPTSGWERGRCSRRSHTGCVRADAKAGRSGERWPQSAPRSRLWFTGGSACRRHISECERRRPAQVRPLRCGTARGGYTAGRALRSSSQGGAIVKQPLTEVRGFILRSKQTLQNSPNMPELYTRAEAPGPTYFLVGLHRLLDRAERVNVLCRTSTTGRLAPTIPRYSAVPPCVDRDTRDGQDCSAIPPLTEVRGFLAETL